MSAEYDGAQIVGIDLHRRRSVIVRMDQAGNRLDTVRIDNDPMVLAEQIAQSGEHPQVVLEATSGWYWAADVLRDAGDDEHGARGFVVACHDLPAACTERAPPLEPLRADAIQFPQTGTSF